MLLQRWNVSTVKASLQGPQDVPMNSSASSHSWSGFKFLWYSRGVFQSDVSLDYLSSNEAYNTHEAYQNQIYHLGYLLPCLTASISKPMALAYAFFFFSILTCTDSSCNIAAESAFHHHTDLEPLPNCHNYPEPAPRHPEPWMEESSLPSRKLLRVVKRN